MEVDVEDLSTMAIEAANSIVDISDILNKARGVLPGNVINLWPTHIHSDIVPVLIESFTLVEAIIKRTGWTKVEPGIGNAYYKKTVVPHFHLPEGFSDPIGLVPQAIGETELAPISQITEQRARQRVVLHYMFSGSSITLPKLEIPTYSFAKGYGPSSTIDLSIYDINMIYLMVSGTGKSNISIGKVSDIGRVYGFHSILRERQELYTASVKHTYSDINSLAQVYDVVVCAMCNIFGARIDSHTVDFDFSSYGHSLPQVKKLLGL